MNHFKQWWVAYGAGVVGLIYSSWPQVREVICQNPKVSGAGLTALIIGVLVKQSPLKQVPSA